MKLEQQVCSPELAKRIKELGVRQGSHVSWHRSRKAECKEWFLGHDMGARYDQSFNIERYAALTVAEFEQVVGRNAVISAILEFANDTMANACAKWFIRHIEEARLPRLDLRSGK